MKRRFLYKVCALTAAGCLAAAMAACGQEQAAGPETDTLVWDEAESVEAAAGAEAVLSQGAPVNILNVEELFTDRDFSGEYDEADCSEIRLESGSVTISEEGTYILTGVLENGMVIVDADKSDKVQLVLDGVTVSNSEGAAIYVRQADKVFITLASGSVNTLTNGGSYVSIDDNNIDSVIFSKDDLTINGEGSLNINAQAGHGIVSKNDLKITGGTITVTAAGHGISGKDSVRVAAGSLNIISGKDGIHSENTEEEDQGYVYLADGNLTVISQGDCISADAWLQIDGGVFHLTAGDGSANGTVAVDENGEAVSTKGIKAGGQLVINAGTFNIDSQDDALHSNGSLTVSGGEFLISTGDDGLHSDETTTVAGGSIDISVCYEGLEGEQVVISGGSIRLYATDDGVNAAGGSDSSGFGGRFGDDFGGGGADGGFDRGNPGGDFGGGESSDSSILISGGQLFIDADGDGIDSNGTLTVTGGEVYVSGPESGADGAIDYETEGKITGGIVVALGNAQMAMNFGDNSTQGSILANNIRGEAGTEILLKDGAGEILLSYTAEKAFQSVVISCPGLVQGGTYTLSVDGSDTEITLESLIYGSGNSMGGFGGRGGRGGQEDWEDRKQNGGKPDIPSDGQMPEGGEFPEGGMPEGEFPEGRMPEEGELPEGGMPGGGFPEGGMPGGGFPEDGELPDGDGFPEDGERLEPPAEGEGQR